MANWGPIPFALVWRCYSHMNRFPIMVSSRQLMQNEEMFMTNYCIVLQFINHFLSLYF